ncbi:MAG TPA: dehydrogenase [Gammaproteobacteria bacterium]|jgi:NAD(P)-dependent dehydrogenase (short-subunit alcohol dehydrogenase family)|nr:dehydrogenase [Acidiferrobacteraceae bacterium]MDP6397940.1 SDR family oxidoreductase [Arenicellales bacterium]HCX86465.1 dehydrogenase [Gammaproteobacteria bacterium]MDP6550834.1 SDR family oxidoreductase [Arenicellales bacterium]MDP6790790.1 SDR family oxidoreductase [Arenicellales bacterium]|tara:strand:- start:3849 stop:4610 length:762 start_codon:yes stop_codon:yes gene_type:complete
MRLQDKVAVITGAAQGIGLGIAQRFAAEGAQIMMLDINEDIGRNAAADIAGARFFSTDISDKQAIDRTVDEIIADTGRIDICVNNAGILRSGDVLEISEEDFDAVLSVNLKGAFLMSQAAGRHMVGAGGGSIINMSSVNGVMTIPNILPYNVSKGGLDQLTRVMAVALADKGVRVNAIGPGSILTELLQQVMTDDAKRRAILSRTPMGRCGDVDEIAGIALFLASDDASYITGQCIYADGGRLALNYTVPVPD